MNAKIAPSASVDLRQACGTVFFTAPFGEPSYQPHENQLLPHRTAPESSHYRIPVSVVSMSVPATSKPPSPPPSDGKRPTLLGSSTPAQSTTKLASPALPSSTVS